MSLFSCNKAKPNLKKISKLEFGLKTCLRPNQPYHSAASLSAGSTPSPDLPLPHLCAALRAMYTEQAAAVRADLPAAYYSTTATSPRTLS